MLNAASAERRLPAQGLGLPLVFHPRLDSTNSLAAELATAGAPHGTLVVAEEQTAGRGRHGRGWSTPPGSALAFSLILRPALPGGEARSRQLAAFNLVGAVALAEALEDLGARPAIKWPNDVLLSDRKVAGVLIEVSWVDQAIDSLVLGVGLNVYAEAEPPEAEVDYPATSVEAAIGFRPSREDLLVQIVGRIGSHCQRIDPPAIMAEVNQRLAFCGRRVSVRSGVKTWQGVLLAIGEGGEIILDVPGEGEVRIAGSDPHLRPLDVHTG
ncbi:MAG: biotin--[acetyl-CoA-carboxylase] ligase [Anaerolineales bacterium]|nr:biotin--[acetyl-CoA-carboxylase] ligase [Anaerolineales bacterium]